MILGSTTIMIMTFYSILTFFISPGIADLLGYSIDSYLAAMSIGFILSIILWLLYGMEYAN